MCHCCMNKVLSIMADVQLNGCAVAAASDAAATPTPVSVGQQTVSTTVSLTYAIC